MAIELETNDGFVWQPRVKLPEIVLASMRLGVLRHVKEDANGLEEEGFREKPLTAMQVYDKLPEEGMIIKEHTYRFRDNPYGMNLADRVGPDMARAVISVVQSIYRPVLTVKTTQALAEMEQFVEDKKVLDIEALASFRRHYGGFVELLSNRRQDVRTVDSQAIVCQYHFWESYIHHRVFLNDQQKATKRVRLDLKRTASEQLAVLQNIVIPRNSPLAGLYHFQKLNLEMDILAELADMGEVEPSKIQSRVSETNYFDRVISFNKIYPWRIEEPVQALIIAAHLGDVPDRMEEFGMLAIEALAIGLACALGPRGIFTTKHPVMTLQSPLFENEEPLIKQKVLRQYIEDIHPKLLNRLKFNDLMARVKATWKTDLR